jgi:hypothetical protein
MAVQATVKRPTLLVVTVPQLAEARPDMASLAPGLAVAEPLSSTGLGETVGLKTGPVASRLIVMLFEAVPPALVAWQVKVIPVVSVATVWELQPVCMMTVDSLSITDQLTLTVLAYQPLLPNVPLIVGVMTGGVVSGVPMIRV